MMGRQSGDQSRLFYEFRLEDRIPKNHLLRRINVFVTAALADVHEQLDPYYSEIGRPSVDPELMIRMLIVGYCYGLRSERKLTQEVELHLAYRWFCRLDLDDKVPHHSTFSENRLHRFRESDIFRHIFERVVVACMAAGLVKGEGFAVDASVMEANASRYHGKAPDEIDWTEKQRQKRAVAEYLAALEAEAAASVDAADDGAGGGPESKRPRRYERQSPKVISPSDPQSAWTAKANKRVQFGYGLNYLIDIENAVIVDVDERAHQQGCGQGLRGCWETTTPCQLVNLRGPLRHSCTLSCFEAQSYCMIQLSTIPRDVGRGALWVKRWWRRWSNERGVSIDRAVLKAMCAVPRCHNARSGYRSMAVIDSCGLTIKKFPLWNSTQSGAAASGAPWRSYRNALVSRSPPGSKDIR